jgi:viroplasmin and RNaseH domain-containing protein
MAKSGLNHFTVQEATNFEAYSDWNYEEADMSASFTSTYITTSNAAKKVIIYDTPGAASSALEATDIISIEINGDSATEKIIKIDATDMPFTLSGLVITSLTLTNSDPNAGEDVAVLSFH